MKRPFQLHRRDSSTSENVSPPEFLWVPEFTTMEQVMDQLETMRLMETLKYKRRDYLHCKGSPYNQTCRQQDSLLKDALYVLQAPTTSATNTSHAQINETTRAQMVDLLYEIADYCHFRRETVAFAVWNIMDRYLSLKNHAPLQTKADFQLVASTSLCIAVKAMEPVSMDVISLADLSKGAFSAKDILKMEKTILMALQWKIAHGPTPIGFVLLYLTLLQMDMQDEHIAQDICLWESLMHQAQYQVELSVSNYSVVIHRHPSEVALAAVWNALESQLECHVAMEWQARLWQYLARAGFDVGHRKRTLPKLQLTLCKLQYTVEVQIQQHQQQLLLEMEPDEEEMAEADESDSDAEQSYFEDEPSCHYDEVAFLTEPIYAQPIDETESDDSTTSPPHLQPSPVSVTSNQLYANYDGSAKAPKSNKSSHSSSSTIPSGFGSFLKSLFFSYD